MNLIFADLIMATLGIPFDIFATFQHGWKMGKYFCDVCGFIHTITGKYLESFSFSAHEYLNVCKSTF